MMDTDCDNLNDAFEVKYGTNPLADDSDGDTYLDSVEIQMGTDPLNPLDYPGLDTAETVTETVYNQTDADGNTVDTSSVVLLTLGSVAVLGVISVILLKKQGILINFKKRSS